MPSRSPTRFFLLVTALSIPWWIMGAFVHIGGLPQNLPVSDLILTFMPMTAALMLVRRSDPPGGVWRLVRRAVDARQIRHRWWLLPILLVMPLLYLLTYEGMRLTGKPLPLDAGIQLGTAVPLALGFFVAAAGEELGYMGYIFDPMEQRWGTWRASLLIGGYWAVWHYPSSIVRGDSLSWLAWGTLGTIGMRCLIIRVYRSTGRSVFAAICFHVMANLGKTRFPGGIRYYDPMIGYGLIAMAGLVALMSGGRVQGEQQ